MITHKGTRELKTQRLLLRKIKESDYIDMYRYTSKKEVARYVTWNVHENIGVTKELCKMWAGEYVNNDRYNWAIVYNNKVIGNIDVVHFIGEVAYMGWQVSNAYWNMGIATEAAIAVRDYLFGEVGAGAMEAAYIKENIGSGRVMQKIGMKEIPAQEYYTSIYYKLEGKTEINGKPLGFYRLTKEEWKNN